MVQDRAIFTMADSQKVAYRLSNGAIFNYLERPLTLFSRSRHSLTLNRISPKWLNIRPYLLWKANRKLYPSFQMVPLLVTFSDR